jgi:hypothetical protein
VRLGPQTVGLARLAPVPISTIKKIGRLPYHAAPPDLVMRYALVLSVDNGQRRKFHKKQKQKRKTVSERTKDKEPRRFPSGRPRRPPHALADEPVSREPGLPRLARAQQRARVPDASPHVRRIARRPLGSQTPLLSSTPDGFSVCVLK